MTVAVVAALVPATLARAVVPATEVDCGNCFDDDGDTLIDRLDVVDCPPSAAGAFAGIADESDAKAAVKCEKAIEKAGTKFVQAKLKRLDTCLNAAFACVQLKPGDTGCHDGAVARCTTEIAGIAADESKLHDVIQKACGMKPGDSSPQVSVADLTGVMGLGFAAEETGCGVMGFATLDEIIDCIKTQHECRAERIVSQGVPRAAELLAFGGRVPALEFPCLQAGSNGNQVGLGGVGAKPAVKCQKTLTKATEKLAKLSFKVVQQCTQLGFTCIQHGDGPGSECVQKASPKCAKIVDKFQNLLTGSLAKLVTAATKGCTKRDLALDDLLLAEGLGFQSETGRCAELGVPALSTIGEVVQCSGVEHLCDGAQMLERKTPRLREIAGLLGVTLPE